MSNVEYQPKAPAEPVEIHGDLNRWCANAIRTLAIDTVQRANSGHPGLPLGTADIAYVVWDRFLHHNPADPTWPNRDRFVLSAGHGSAMLYALLHLTGYDLPLDELLNFRQWGSRTPGHPEYGLTPGVEATTGPLGQGFGTGVGMALAEAMLAARFNRPGFPIVDHYTYVLVSDGDLMEGVASEAASLAGHLGLGKLIYLYDDNHISIEGNTDITFTEDVAARFRAYGWHVQKVDGYDQPAIAEAIRLAQTETTRPSLIVARTHIGYGSPHKQDSAAAHGSPLGEEEVRLTKEALGWPGDARFWVPDAVLEHFRQALDRGAKEQEAWGALLERYRRSFPDLAEAWDAAMSGELPAGWDENLPTFDAGGKPLATRKASEAALNAAAPYLPTLVGGSADLSVSNNTFLKGYADVNTGAFAGRNLHFGVREHSMGAVLNGMALHGGLRPYGGTFLVFSDYMRPSIRLAAMMHLPVIYVFTHDSIGLGEDGPTHQPVEHLAALRAIPNLWVVRPAEANETVLAWKIALERKEGPTALILTRQGLPILDADAVHGAARGGYVLADAEGGTADVILLASGSEVSLAMEAREALAGQGIAARVVSMISWKLFDAQPKTYRDAVLPPTVTARLAIEAGVSQGWHKYVGDGGDVISIERFGASAPYRTVMRKYGFSVENVVRHVR
ncbi:MAG: transketolase [Chloroflexi bacterium]|nr:transketolase [Chloroflexota bacterium]